MGHSVNQSDLASWTGAIAASFFDASEDCVKVVSIDGDLVAMNANGICLLEIDDFEQMRGKPWTNFWPEAAREQVSAAVTHACEGHGTKFYADCPTAKGKLKSWEVTVWPVLDGGGRATQLISISRDITDRKRAEAENALLAEELAHRIKNTFAVVDGVVSMSARAANEAKAFADGLRDRLRALGRAMAYVVPPEQPEAQARMLHGLLGALLEPYGLAGGGTQSIFVSGDDVAVLSGATTPIALIMNELATNSIKYGALREPDGRVDVAIGIERGSLLLHWRESGALVAGALPDRARSGFGSALLENAVTRQMGGRIQRDWLSAGLAVRLEFPLDRITPT